MPLVSHFHQSYVTFRLSPPSTPHSAMLPHSSMPYLVSHLQPLVQFLHLILRHSRPTCPLDSEPIPLPLPRRFPMCLTLSQQCPYTRYDQVVHYFSSTRHPRLRQVPRQQRRPSPQGPKHRLSGSFSRSWPTSVVPSSPVSTRFFAPLQSMSSTHVSESSYFRHSSASMR
jgi:hypothetical protein